LENPQLKRHVTHASTIADATVGARPKTRLI